MEEARIGAEKDLVSAQMARMSGKLLLGLVVLLVTLKLELLSVLSIFYYCCCLCLCRVFIVYC